MGTASLVLGIIALVFSTIFGFFGVSWIGIICGIIAVILGALGQKKGLAYSKAGMILGIISLSVGIVTTIACLACAGAAVAATESAMAF